MVRGRIAASHTTLVCEAFEGALVKRQQALGEEAALMAGSYVSRLKPRPPVSLFLPWVLDAQGQGRAGTPHRWYKAAWIVGDHVYLRHHGPPGAFKSHRRRYCRPGCRGSHPGIGKPRRILHRTYAYRVRRLARSIRCDDQRRPRDSHAHAVIACAHGAHRTPGRAKRLRERSQGGAAAQQRQHQQKHGLTKTLHDECPGD